MYRTTLCLMGCSLFLTLSGGCAFIEAATEQELGGPGTAQEIPVVNTQIALPSVDSLTGLDAAQMEELAQQGFPSSLASGTFAHLQGALALSGDCSLSQSIEPEDDLVEDLGIEVVSCTDDGRCADLCPDNFYGMRFTAEVTLPIVDEETAAKVKESTQDLTIKGDAIKQIRFQVQKLDFYQTTSAGQTVSFNPWLADFQLKLAKTDGTDEVLVIDFPYLSSISEETPQRFDVESKSQFTKDLKDDILEGLTVSIKVILTLAIAQEDLYEVGFDGAGLDIQIQPELIISVVEVIKDQI